MEDALQTKKDSLQMVQIDCFLYNTKLKAYLCIKYQKVVFYIYKRFYGFMLLASALLPGISVWFAECSVLPADVYRTLLYVIVLIMKTSL